MAFLRIFALVGLLLVAIGNSNGLPKLANVKGLNMLMDRLFALVNVGTGNPEQTAACFDKYLPILTDIQNTFNTDYQDCISIAAQKMTVLTTEAETNKTAFIQDSNQLCSGFQTCQNDQNVLNVFTCYANVAQQNVSMLYELSVNATSDAATLLKEIQLIRDNEDQCTNATQNAYVENTALTYDQLDMCLGNGLSATTPSTADNNFRRSAADQFLVRTQILPKLMVKNEGVTVQDQFRQHIAVYPKRKDANFQ